MFEGGTSESPAIYEITYLSDPSQPVGYLEIVDNGDSEISAHLAQGVGWPIGVPNRSGVVFERVTAAPSGNFPHEHSSQISNISINRFRKKQVVDGGFEIGKHESDGWKQFGLLLSDGSPQQSNQLGMSGSTFPIPTSMGDRIRIIWRDISSTQDLVTLLNHELADGWTGVEFDEDYS